MLPIGGPKHIRSKRAFANADYRMLIIGGGSLPVKFATKIPTLTKHEHWHPKKRLWARPWAARRYSLGPSLPCRKRTAWVTPPQAVYGPCNEYANPSDYQGERHSVFYDLVTANID